MESLKSTSYKKGRPTEAEGDKNENLYVCVVKQRVNVMFELQELTNLDEVRHQTALFDLH